MHSYKVKYNDRCINSESKSSVKFTPAWINSHPNAEMNQLLESACCSRKMMRRWKSTSISPAVRGVRAVRAVPASERAAGCLVGDEANEPWRSRLVALAAVPALHSARRVCTRSGSGAGAERLAKRTSQLVQRVSRKQRLQQN